MPLPDLPTKRTPGWEFTDLTGLDAEAFGSSEPGDAAALERATLPLSAPEGALEIVQVDGGSLNGEAPDGGGDLPTEAVACSLQSACDRWSGIASLVGTLVDDSDPFVARNAEAWRGGALVYVPSGASLDEPVSLKAIVDSDTGAISYRSLIVLEEGAEAEVWEQWGSSSADGSGIFNGVTEILVGQGATLRFVSAQALGSDCWAFASQRAEVGRDATLDWVALGLGGKGGKVRMDTKLVGEGSTARVTGGYAGGSEQHLDFDTTQVHAAASTVSDLAFRGVLADQATSVWRGMIRVEPGAQQTDAFQESRNLLLAKTAHADAIPGLEIEADDVRCTHAAAVAQIDPEQVYYLRSHGLPEEVARGLVIEGFLESLVERVAAGPIREQVSSALADRLEAVLA